MHTPLLMRSLKTLLTVLFASAALLVSARAQSKVEPPIPLRTVSPEIPKELRREGLSGVVMVKCAIDDKGDVTEVSVDKSSHPELEAPALAALKKWKFRPAQQDGHAVAVKVSIPVRFVVDAPSA